MRNIKWTRGIVWLLACAMLLTVVGIRLNHSRPSKETALTGRFTKTEILSRSEPLLQALFVGATKIETVTSPISTFNSTGQTVHHWNIDSTDMNTGDIAHLLWNADTGELVRASHYRKKGSFSEYNAPTAQKEADGLAWDWFHALKINRPSEEWRIVGVRRKPYAQWDICLRAGDHYSILTVKTDTGELVQALCGHLPSAKMAWVPFKTAFPS